MELRLEMHRWYLGLHVLALLRGWPFEDPDAVAGRMDAMRRLLDGEGKPETFEERRVDALDVDTAYRDWAATYDGPNALIVAEERAMSGVLASLPPGRAADVAAGTGRLAATLSELGHRTVAVDGSEAMLARVRGNAPDALMSRADMRRSPLRDGSFDVVTCALALTHVRELRPAVEGFARILAPGGALVVSDIHPFAVATGGHAFFQREDGSRAVTRNEVHRPGAYVDAARAAGLTVERCLDVLVDEDILQELEVGEDPLEPMRAIVGLPFASIWMFRAPA